MELSRVKKILFLWFPALVWAGIIFYLSNQSGLSAGFSTPNEILARKIAHVTEYGVLVWLTWRLCHFGYRLKIAKSVALSIMFVALYAASDELHQIFVMDRAGKLADVAVDILGATLALQIIVPIYIRKFKIWMLSVIIALLILLSLLVVHIINQAEAAKMLNQTQDAKTNEPAGQTNDSVSGQMELIEKPNEDSSEAPMENSAQSVELPKQVQLDVPFTSQAPFAAWDEVHEEACEEASLIMVKYFLDGKKLSAQVAENEIQNLKEYQLKTTGHFDDSDMEELVEIAKGYYGLDNLKVVYGITKDDLKEELAKGNPVIVPTAGRELGNPNFTQPGPLYHNLVLVGYQNGIFITNDPGTKKGENYKYDESILFNAIHDFPGNIENIIEGPKVMVVVR